MTLKFNPKYFLFFLALFFIEALIASYVEPGFVRSIFGDYLVVILLYCFFKSFVKAKSIHVALIVLLIAYIIEFLQLTKFLNILHIKENSLANLVLGNTFQIEDLIAYTLGILTVIYVDYRFKNNDISKD